MLVAPSPPNITLVAIEMGYGHLRPAHALAGELGVPVYECDRPPVATEGEQRLWGRVRTFYEGLSRLSTGSRLLGGVLDGITQIDPLDGDLRAPNGGARGLDWVVRHGLGSGLARWLDDRSATLLTTFYAPAISTDRLSRAPAYCVVTDADINRVWAPLDGATSRLHFFAPSPRVVRRLRAYGVGPERITFSGFPLPGELIGGRERSILKRNLAARLVRLDPSRAFIGPHRAELERQLGPLPDELRGQPPHLVFAVGGAGAQVPLALEILANLRPHLRSGRLTLTLVAGVRQAVADRFKATLDREGTDGVSILVEPDIPKYLGAFNALLARADALWTKPSEMSFFAALGLPLIFSPPVGVHEAYNRQWVVESGGGLAQREPAHTAGWLDEWLSDGTLAAAAWTGATRLPNLGVYEISDAVRRVR
jgi:hypothetical protein